jgi:hypothetical protein
MFLQVSLFDEILVRRLWTRKLMKAILMGNDEHWHLRKIDASQKPGFMQHAS